MVMKAIQQQNLKKGGSFRTIIIKGLVVLEQLSLLSYAYREITTELCQQENKSYTYWEITTELRQQDKKNCTTKPQWLMDLNIVT